MTAYTTLTDATLTANKPIKQSIARAWRDNPIAITEGSAGAPKIQTAALEQTASSEAVTTATIRALAVTEAKLAASAVAQGKLKTSLGQLMHTSGIWALPGGEYGFFPQVGSNVGAGEYTSLDAAAIWGASTASWFGKVGQVWGGEVNILSNSSCGGGHIQQRYVTASPPYDYGHGEAGLFVFVKLDRNGNMRGVSLAPDPPWAFHGPTWVVPDYYRNVGKVYTPDDLPTDHKLSAEQIASWCAEETARNYDVRGFQRRLVVPDDKLALLNGDLQWEEVEVTQAIKNADMDIVPHPFGVEPDITIALLDPCGELAHRLAEMHDVVTSQNGQVGADSHSFDYSPVGYLLHEGYIQIDNTPLDMRTPKGVLTVGAKWKRTR